MRPFNVLFVVFLLTCFSGLAQTSTPNIGFEDGTFDHWQCYIGGIDKLGVITVNPTMPVYNRQTIYGKEATGELDPYGKFPVLCPNGSKYSIRLGNNDTSAQAERVTYLFTVPKDNAYSIILNYAVVLENPNHAPFQQPKFTAQVYDATDETYVNCPSFDFVAPSELPGFKLSSAQGAKNATIFYKDWSTATIDLRGYKGKTIQLVFTTNDCTLGGHFGYAYLDLDEDAGSAIAGNSYCVGQKSVTLYAPNGFASYAWYNADLTKYLGSGQSMSISPPPPDMTKYAVTILPYPGLGCADTLYTTVNKIDEGFKLNVQDTLYGCPGTGADLTAPAITAGSSPGMALDYFNDALATSHLYNPDMVTTSGVYYIQGVNASGCMNILPVQVIIGNPEIAVTDPPAVVFPATVDLTKSYTPQPGLSYSYYTDAGITKPLENYTAIQYGGIYYIKVVNIAGCINVVPVNVVIEPPTPYTVTAPNVFTPNNDGINDHFMVKVTGIVTFESVSVYNRYGQLVYTTRSPEGYWDGNFNGRKLPAGTYYWIFDGTDDYHKTQIHQGASITVIR
jgi:gliding motility-associated-like protein